MYPDLSYIFHDLIGTDYDNWLAIFKTFGLLLAIAFLTAGYIVYRELLRLEKEGGPLHAAITTIKRTVGEAPTWQDVVPGLIVGFLLGFKIPYVLSSFAAFKEDPSAIIFSFSGNWLFGILGAIAMGGFYYWEKNRTKLPQPQIESFALKPSDRVGDIVVVAAISGVLGAKLFAMAETMDNINSIEDFFTNLFSGNGLAIYGGLVGGFIGVAWYVRKMKMPLLTLMDISAPAMIMAMGIGRLGCHFSGDGDWGIAAAAQPDWWFLPDWLWSWDYPRDVNMGVTNQEGIERLPYDCGGCKYQWKLGAKVYPTSVYEFFNKSILIFGALWMLRKRIKIPGVLFFLFMSLYGIERWFIEKIRVNDTYEQFGNLSQAEIISVLFFCVGIFGMGILYARNKN